MLKTFDKERSEPEKTVLHVKWHGRSCAAILSAEVFIDLVVALREREEALRLCGLVGNGEPLERQAAPVEGARDGGGSQ